MARRIAVLTEELINQIAAGEVVERPASVVKELGENALDAGATSIRVRIRGGGLEAISVFDDGHGMSREDACLCVLRHATSKLCDPQGLEEIGTLGFRGEALAAIAAVSRFTLVTSEREAPLGTRLELLGGGEVRVTDAAGAGGTEIHVEELFFNTPARRKFLRRAETEQRHVQEAVIRLALPHLAIGFTLEADGRVLLAFPRGASARERLIAAVGAEVAPHLLELDERRLGVWVHGVVASPELTLSNARGLYTFVNGRYVRDRGLNAAIQRAFGGALPPGRQPVAAIFVEVDPRAVDVNVHPQKLEVRFLDARTVQEAIHAAIARALGGAPWQRSGPVEPAPAEAAHYALAVDRFLSQAGAGGWGAPLPLPAVRDVGVAPGFGLARPDLNGAPPPGYFGQLRYLGVLGRRFLACEGPGGTLVIVDRHAAVERLWRERLWREGGGSQAELFSAAVELAPSEAAALGPRREALARLGLAIEPFGGGAFSVRAPSALAAADLRSALVELMSVLPADGSLSEDALATGRAVIACHAATGDERIPGQDEVKRMFEQLDAADFGLECLHARVVLMEVPFLELERRARSKS